MTVTQAAREARSPNETDRRSGAADIPELTACDREPIRTPGRIQPHGVLLAVDAATLRVTAASTNVDRRLGRPPAAVLGRPLADVLGGEAAAAVAAALPGLAYGAGPQYLRTVVPPPLSPPTPAGSPAAGRTAGDPTAYYLLAHQAAGAVVVELEEAGGDDLGASFDAVYPLLRTLVAKLGTAADEAATCDLAAGEVRAITGFDRVLVYRFDEQWDGTVVAESRNDRLPSYLGLRFPASDIPAQARDLYRLNKIRLIPTATYEPAAVVAAAPGGGGAVAAAGSDLDLSFASLRSVSPVHLEYMRNMGTAASMSASVVVGDRLWGLVSCHHHAPRRLPFHVRTACEFVAQVLSLRLAAQAQAAADAERLELKAVQARLLSRMAAADDFRAGLLADPADLLGLTRAAGAAVVSGEGACGLVGAAPPEAFVRALVEWLKAAAPADVYATDELAAAFPAAAAHADAAAGVLAVPFSKLHANYVIWFRPELVRTVTWGGDPRKPPPDHAGRIHPRASFEAWKQTVRGRSAGWRAGELDAAAELRNNVVGIVLRQAEERAELTGRLEASNKELEAFSYSVSHDLRAPFRHIVGYAELLKETQAADLGPDGRRFVETIIESAHHAGTLVDNLLSFSQMGRASLNLVAVDAGRLVDEVRADVMRDAPGRTIRWVVGPLPTVRADLIMLRLAVENLLSNAVKYTRDAADATIEVGCDTDDREHVFRVADNGVGFDMKYVDKLFGVFQRLHRMEEFEGTGIGLANVRRIIARHGGRTWAVGAVGKGATFYFTLPRTDRAGIEAHDSPAEAAQAQVSDNPASQPPR
jgi:chemotaxis family two-component system sensor kinase Cph1